MDHLPRLRLIKLVITSPKSGRKCLFCCARLGAQKATVCGGGGCGCVCVRKRPQVQFSHGTCVVSQEERTRSAFCLLPFRGQEYVPHAGPAPPCVRAPAPPRHAHAPRDPTFAHFSPAAGGARARSCPLPPPPGGPPPPPSSKPDHRPKALPPQSITCGVMAPACEVPGRGGTHMQT